MKNDKIFDCRKASSTFYKIMKKYNKRNKNKILDNKGSIANAIEEKRDKLQFEEKDDMYIYKEAKNVANMNEVLLGLYGNKAKKRYYDISKIVSPIKLERRLFFPQNKKEEKNIEDKNYLTGQYFNMKGFMKLPLIFKNFIYNKGKEHKSAKNLLTVGNMRDFEVKKLSKKSEKKNEKKSVEKNNKKEKIGIDALKLKISNNNKNMSRNNENNNIITFRERISKSNKNILLTQIQKNIVVKEYKNKKKDLNNYNKRNMTKTNNDNKKIKYELTVNENYISKLTDFKDLLIKEEKEKRVYFNNNDYGCQKFKEKYNYLMKNVFI